MSHLDPLPAELAAVRSQSQAAHAIARLTTDSLLSRLERARSLLAEPSHASPAQDLVAIDTFLREANQDQAKAYKEWGNAVAKLQKSVDRKYGAPASAPFPPAPPKPNPNPTLNLHPSLRGLHQQQHHHPRTSRTNAEASPEIPFSHPETTRALHETIAAHLARIGAFDSLETFLSESGLPAPAASDLSPAVLAGLRDLHAIVGELNRGRCDRAIEWVQQRRRRVQGKDNVEAEELLFQLRKEDYIRLVLRRPRARTDDGPDDDGRGEAMDVEPTVPAGDRPRRKSSLASTASSILDPPSTAARRPDPHTQAALTYGGEHFRPFLSDPARATEIYALLTSALYPLHHRHDDDASSSESENPYATLYRPYRQPGESPSASLFTRAYLETLDLAHESPLTVVTDVGSTGALAKIMKVRAVMKEKKTEWSAVGELPVEIPLPTRYRYHSVFACPVSKEQATELNPPMLLPCGHVIARESLMRLARGTPTLKCPYCPVVSHFNACVRVRF
ncbi:hypothetical protein BMF94_3853 [Rhodotorula taiwanensis]|uniref:GID complex catalytic subunit 2 n=1 Tax=Rhodotorula taiwanensis TaxID=741276 RepID=A0A2S5B8M3_9BASI|nr:hypothetical protein BMF94_3853 [Rhodotorula taiwanensis]